MSLSDAAVRAAKPREKPYKLTDSSGLHLLIRPNGSKLWRLKYRFVGREKLLSFGAYPVISLADARKRRDDAKRLLADGTDPSVKKKHDKIVPLTRTALPREQEGKLPKPQRRQRSRRRTHAEAKKARSRAGSPTRATRHGLTYRPIENGHPALP